MDLEEFQNYIGGISRYQIVVIIAATWLAFSSGFSTQSAVFISAIPEYRCAVPPIDNPTLYPGLSEEDIKNYTIPYDSVRRAYDSCHRYAYNLSECTGGDDFNCITSHGNPGNIPCDEGYYYDRTYYDETSITQWNLVCDRQYLDSIANTLFFLGFFIGSAMLGPLSDWFGRSIAMLVSSIGLIASSVGCAFVPTLELFMFVRVLTGTFTIMCFISSYTYCVEISSTKWRTAAGAFCFVTQSLSHCSYPGIAYALRDWRYIQLILGIAPLPSVFLYFVLPESPKWLLRTRREEQAREIVRKYAASKGKVLQDYQWSLIIQSEKDKIEKSEEANSAEKVAIWDLFRRPLMRFMSINVMICWFTVSMTFYGLALNGGNLAGDPYVNNTLNAVVELVGFGSVYFAAFVGRRPLASLSYTLAGIFCIASMLFALYAGENGGMLSASTAMALAGKLFASLNFALIYAMTSEIFPTHVRTTAISMGSMAARVGAMMSPFILQLQSTIPWLTQTVFGTLSIICGGLTLFYPETVKVEYMTSLDEAEAFYRSNTSLLRWCNKKPTKTNVEISKKLYDNNNGVVDDEDRNKITKL